MSFCIAKHSKNLIFDKQNNTSASWNIEMLKDVGTFFYITSSIKEEKSKSCKIQMTAFVSVKIDKFPQYENINKFKLSFEQISIVISHLRSPASRHQGTWPLLKP